MNRKILLVVSVVLGSFPLAGLALAAFSDSTVHIESAPLDSAAMDSLASGLVRSDSAAAALTVHSNASPAETLTVTRVSSAPVFLGGRVVFRVRVGRDGLDPAARAAAIRSRLTQAVTDERVNPDSTRLFARADGIQLQLGPYFLWLITPGDIPSHDPVELAAQLSELPRQVRDGVLRERAARKPARLLVSAAFALVLTLMFAGSLRLLMLGSRAWQAWLRAHIERRLPAVRVRNFELLSRTQVSGILVGILARLDIVAELFLLYAYLTAVFSQFPWTQGWSAQLVTFAFAQAILVVRSIASGIPGLFAIALIFFFFRWFTGVTARFFDAIADGRLVFGSFHPELAVPSRKLSTILLWLIGIMVAYPYVPGSGSRAVQGVSLLFGLVLSLGSTGIIGNMIAGVVLTYSRSFRAGDRVRIGEHVGDVVTLGFFATKLKSLRNEEVTIPNGQVAAASILNYTRLAEDDGLILHTQVSIGYDVDWRRVHALLIEAARKVDGIEHEPEPWVLQRSLDDNYPTYELCCVTRDSHAQLRLYSDLHAEIQDAFSRAGVEILSPTYHAIRDANAQVLPAEPGGPRESPGGFRLSPRD